MTNLARQALKGSGILEVQSLREEIRATQGSTGNPLRAYFQSQSASRLSKWDHYFDIYHALLQKFRDLDNVRLLEIGVWKGGSLKMWRDYLPPSASIIGVDSEVSCREYEDVSENIHVRIGDQADPAFLNRLRSEFGPFDIVIDDGGHTTNQQITSFRHLYPETTLRGIYLVEDLHASYWDEFNDRSDGVTFLDLARDLIDYLHDPYREHSGGFRFAKHNPRKVTSLEVTQFYRETQSIQFFDSVVAFIKGKREFPKTEIR